MQIECKHEGAQDNGGGSHVQRAANLTGPNLEIHFRRSKMQLQLRPRIHPWVRRACKRSTVILVVWQYTIYLLYFHIFVISLVQYYFSLFKNCWHKLLIIHTYVRTRTCKTTRLSGLCKAGNNLNAKPHVDCF